MQFFFLFDTLKYIEMKKLFSVSWRIFAYGILLLIFIFILLSIPLPLHWFPERIEYILAEQGLTYEDGYIIPRRGIYLRNVVLEREELQAASDILTLRIDLLSGVLQRQWVISEVSFASVQVTLLETVDALRERWIERAQPPEEKDIPVDWQAVYADKLQIRGILPYGDEWNFNNVHIEKEVDHIEFGVFYNIVPGALKGSIKGTADTLFQNADIQVQGSYHEIAPAASPLITRGGNYAVSFQKSGDIFGGRGRVEFTDLSWSNHSSSGFRGYFEVDEIIPGEGMLDRVRGSIQIQSEEAEIFDMPLEGVNLFLERPGEDVYYDLKEERGLLAGNYSPEKDLLNFRSHIKLSERDLEYVMDNMPEEVRQHITGVSLFNTEFRGSLAEVQKIIKKPALTASFLELEMPDLNVMFGVNIHPDMENIELSLRAEDVSWKSEGDFSWKKLLLEESRWGNVLLTDGKGSISEETAQAHYDLLLNEAIFQAESFLNLLPDIQQGQIHSARAEGFMQLENTSPYVTQAAIKAGEILFQAELPENISPYFEDLFYLDMKELDWDGTVVQAESLSITSKEKELLLQITEGWTDLSEIQGDLFIQLSKAAQHPYISEWMIARLGRNVEGNFSFIIPRQTGEVHLANEEKDFRSRFSIEENEVMLVAEVPGVWTHLDYDLQERFIQAAWDIESYLAEEEVLRNIHLLLDEHLAERWDAEIRLEQLNSTGNISGKIGSQDWQGEAVIADIEFLIDNIAGAGKDIRLAYYNDSIHFQLEKLRWGDSLLEELQVETGIIREDDTYIVDRAGDYSTAFQLNIQQMNDVIELPDMRLFNLEKGIIGGQVHISGKKLKSLTLNLENVQAYSEILPYHSIFVHTGQAEGDMEKSEGTFTVTVDDMSKAESSISHNLFDGKLSLYFDSQVDYFDIGHFIDNFSPDTIRGALPERAPEEERLFRIQEVQALFNAEETWFSDWDLSETNVEVYYLAGEPEIFVRGSGNDVYGGKGSYLLTFKDGKMKHNLEVAGISVARYWDEYVEKSEPFMGRADWNLEIKGDKGQGDFIIHDFQLAQVDLMTRMRQVIPPPFGAIVDELKFEEVTGKFDVNLEKTRIKFYDILAENAFVRVYVQGNQIWEEEYLRLDMSFGISTRYLRRVTGIIPGLSHIIALPFETINRMFGGMLFLSYENDKGKDRFFMDTKVRDIFQRDGIIRRYFGSD